MAANMDATIKSFLKDAVPMLRPDDANYMNYEKAVVTSNLLYRFNRPRCVVQPETIAHVQSIVKQAKANKVLLAIRCGGHSYAGFSTAEDPDCILVDLRKMNKVKLDVAKDTITIDGGCQWGEVYRALINGGHDGFIINGGRCPYVGVGGYMLGGGLGPFTRSFGMGSDTLLEATLVTASGNKIKVSKKDKPDSKEGQLFWALRGAGSANFGIVTEMKLQIQHLKKSRNGWVVGGRFQWFPTEKDMDQLLPTMNEFYKTDWPDEITIDSTWLCDLRQKAGDGVRFIVYYDGNKADYDALIDKHIKNPTVNKQLKKRALPEPSTRFLYETLEAQWFDETKKFFAENKTYRVFSSFCFTRQQILQNVDKITKILQDHMILFREKNPGEDVNLDIVWIHTGGQAMRMKPTDTAYFWREANYHVYVEVLWQDKWMEKIMRKFMSTLRQKLRPYSMKGEAAFFNFPDRDFVKAAYERAYWGDNRKKLREIKEMWDPDNVFKWLQGIQLPRRAKDDELIDVDPPNTDGLTDGVAGDAWGKRKWQHQKTTDLLGDLRELEELGF